MRKQQHHMSGKGHQNGDKIAKDLLRRAQEAKKCGKTAKALRLYKKSAKMGCVEAMVALYRSYSPMFGRMSNREKRKRVKQRTIERLFKRQVAKLGYPTSLVDFHYLSPKDEFDFSERTSWWQTLKRNARARKWQKKAAMRDAEEAEKLAKCYEQERGMVGFYDDYRKNIREAIRWYKKAAPECPQSAERLGEIYEKGEGVERDTEAAIIWYERAIAVIEKQGPCVSPLDGKEDTLPFHHSLSRIACTLARIYAEERDDSRAGYWKKTAEKHENAYNEKKRQQVTAWREDFLSRCRAAAEEGKVEAMAALGKMYEDGILVPKDASQAVAWYEKAEAWDDLFQMFMNGNMGEKDAGKAISYLEVGAERGSSHCMICLGRLYEVGEDVEQDIKSAIRWYEKAAAIGDQEGKDAAYKLGRIYEKGIGVEKDQEKAVSIYREAAEAGDYQSAYRLFEIFKARGDSIQAKYWERRQNGNFEKQSFNPFPNHWLFEYLIGKDGKMLFSWRAKDKMEEAKQLVEQKKRKHE